jgi:hypothetical protein
MGVEAANLATRFIDESVIAKDAPAIRSLLFKYELERNMDCIDIVLAVVARRAHQLADDYLKNSKVGSIAKSYYYREQAAAMYKFAAELEGKGET